MLRRTPQELYALVQRIEPQRTSMVEEWTPGHFRVRPAMAHTFDELPEFKWQEIFSIFD